MNILVFSWRDPKHPLAGGAEQVMHEHMKGWVIARHTVTLISSKMKGLKEDEEIDGVRIIRKGNQYLGVQIKAFFYYLKNHQTFDLIIDQFHGLPFFTPLYVRKPILAVIQETAREVWFLNPLPPPLNLLVGLLGFLGEPLIFQIYKKIKFMTGSTSAKKQLTSFGIPEKNIQIVHHGVIVEKPLRMASKEQIFTITYLGILSKDKGIEDAIKCFQQLSRRGNFQFWVIGKPETQNYAVKIQKLVEQLKLTKQIKFWGYVTQEQKFELLARSHLLINTSVREGWGLVNIEANSAGVPVVSYNSPGLSDSVRANLSGLLCTCNNPEELSELIIKLIQDEGKYKELVIGAKNWAKQFSWKDSCKESLSLLESLFEAESQPDVEKTI